MKIGLALILMSLLVCSGGNAEQSVDRDNPQSYRFDQLDMTEWELSWSDEFDYEDAQLDANWHSKTGEFESEWVLGRRWRKNAVVVDGVLELRNIKDENDPHVWSSASVWTRESFGYGYYEARYKYAGAYGTNNSFWFWPEHGTPEGLKECEIDVNEGHYPNIMNTNVHNWTDTWKTPGGRETHHDDQLHHTLFGEPAHTITLDEPLPVTKARLRSNNPASIHIREFRVFSSGENLSLADDAVFTTVGVFNRLPSKEEYDIDGNPDTRWVSAKHGAKWMQLEWPEPQLIDSIELLNGWPQSDGAHRNLISDYTLEVYDGESWHELASYDASTVADFSEEFHTFGVEWSEDWFKWYLDGELFYTLRNDVCFSDVSILLSMAILNFDIAGPATDAIDGTSMKVDYVRYYTRRGEDN